MNKRQDTFFWRKKTWKKNPMNELEYTWKREKEIEIKK